MSLARYAAHDAPGVPGRGSILGQKVPVVLFGPGHTSISKTRCLGEEIRDMGSDGRDITKIQNMLREALFVLGEVHSPLLS